MAKTKAIVPTTQETGIVPGDWLEDMKKEAQDLAAKYKVTSTRISFKSDGTIHIGDNEVANPLPVLIADAAFENALYEGKYEPGKYTAPVCYAVGRDVETMKPHPQAPKPQHADCKSCPLNQFGSSGKGKACKNSVRLICLSGSVTETDVATAEALPCSIPPTSINAWGSYVKGLRDGGLVPWATITNLKVDQFKTFFKVSFQPVQKITQGVWFGLKARKASFEEQLLQPFSQPAEEEKPKSKGARKF